MNFILESHGLPWIDYDCSGFPWIDLDCSGLPWIALFSTDEFIANQIMVGITVAYAYV